MYEHSDAFINKLDGSIKKAIEKHPGFAGSPWNAVSLLSEELGEVAQAVNDGQPDRAMDELLDLSAVCYRFYHMLRREQLDREAKK